MTDYICPRCGPDKDGPEAHERNYHTFPDDSELWAALRAERDRLRAEVAALRAKVTEQHSALLRIAFYPIHSEPLGGALNMQEIASAVLNSTTKKGAK